MIKRAHPFYNSKRWRKTRKAYLAKVFYLCEKCQRPAGIVHHKVHLKDSDYTQNEWKCYAFDNLQALCLPCHNDVHLPKQKIDNRFKINMTTGEVIPV